MNLDELELVEVEEDPLDKLGLVEVQEPEPGLPGFKPYPDEAIQGPPDTGSRDISSADLPSFYQSPERMRAESISGAGPHEAGTGLVTAVGASTGLFDSPEEAAAAARQREVDAIERSRMLKAGGEDIPTILKAATATHAGLTRAGQLPMEVASLANTLTGFPHLMDKLGIPSPSGGKSWVADEQAYLEHIAKSNQKMAEGNADIYGPNAPAWQLAEGAVQALAELPANFIGAGVVGKSRQLGAIANTARSVAGSAVASGIQGAARRQASERGAGRGEFEALPSSIASGVITAVTTKAFGASGVESVFRKEGIKGLWNKVKNTLVHAGLEGVEESSDEAQQILLDLIDNKKVSAKEAVNRLLVSGTIGAIVGGAVSGGHSGLEALLNRGTEDAQTKPQTTEAGRELPKDSIFNEGTLGGDEKPGVSVQPQSETNATHQTSLSESEQEEAHQLLQAEKEGKLSLQDSQRLQQLKDIEASGLSIEERDILSEIADESGREADIRSNISSDEPMSRITARPNKRTGKIEINPSELRAVMDGMNPDEKRDYLRSMFDEESIHFATDHADALKFIQNATGLEKFLAAWRYTGQRSGKTIHGDTISQRNLGHEMLRLHMQKMRGMTPTEVTMSVKSGKLTTQAIIATERAIFQIRKALGTNASKQQVEALNAVQKNLDIAKRAAGIKPNIVDEEDESNASIRIRGDAAPELNTFIQEFMKDDAKISNDSKTEGAVTTLKTGMALKGVSDLDGLLELKKDLAAKIANARAEAMKDPSKMQKYAALAVKGQWIREVAEIAVNAGSWTEGEGFGKEYGKRPLDWREKPEVRRWLQKNGDAIGVRIAAEEPGSVRRSGPRAEIENNSKLAEQLVETITNSKTPEEARERHKDVVDRINRWQGKIVELANKAKKGSVFIDENGELDFDARLFLDMNPAIQEWLLPSVQRLKSAKNEAYMALNSYEGAAEVDVMKDLSDDQINQDIIQLSNRSATGLTEDEQKQMAALRKERDRRFEEYQRNSDQPFSVRRFLNNEKGSDTEKKYPEIFAAVDAAYNDFAKSHKKDYGENPPTPLFIPQTALAMIHEPSMIGMLSADMRDSLLKVVSELKKIPQDERIKFVQSLRGDLSEEHTGTIPEGWVDEDTPEPDRVITKYLEYLEDTDFWQSDRASLLVSDLIHELQEMEDIVEKHEKTGSITKLEHAKLSSSFETAHTMASVLGEIGVRLDRFGRIVPGSKPASGGVYANYALSLAEQYQEYADLSNEIAMGEEGGEDEGPASIRRGGMNKKAAEIAEKKRRIAEMFAKSRGEELPPELQSKTGPASGSFVNPVAEEERVGPEAGGVKRPSPLEIETQAKKLLEGEIKGRFRAKKGERLEKEVEEVEATEAETGRRAVGEEGVQTGKVVYDRPTFDKFANAVGWDMTSEELFPIWENAVWKHLLGASSERLTQWRKALGLEKRLGTREILDEAKGETGEAAKRAATAKIEQTIDRMEKKANELESEAKKASNKGEAEAGGLFAGTVTASGDAMSRAQAIRSRVSQMRYLLRSGATVPGVQSTLPGAKQTGIPGIEQPRDKTKAKVPGATAGLAAKRYRSTVMSHIGRALLEESSPRKVVYDRDEVGIDDIDFSNKKTAFGAYTDLSRDDVLHRDQEGKPSLLIDILRDQARGSSLDPESASKRAVAVSDKSGKVYLVTTYNDAGVQRITDPMGGTSKAKPNRELNDAFLKQYRPFASVLLTDPVKGLHQRFDSVSDFMEQIGNEASSRESIDDLGVNPEGDPNYQPDVPLSEQGGEGIEGEGGSFMGPGKKLISESSRPSRPFAGGSRKVNAVEADALVTTIRSAFEDGTPENVDDVIEQIDTLFNKAESGEITPKERLAITALNKMFKDSEIVQKKAHGGLAVMDTEQTVERLAENIYDIVTAGGGANKSKAIAEIIKAYGGDEVAVESMTQGPRNLPQQLQTKRETPGARFTRVQPKKPYHAPGITGKMGTGQLEMKSPRGEFFTPSKKSEKYTPYGEMNQKKTDEYNARVAHNNKLAQEAKRLQESMLREKGVKLSWPAAARAVGLDLQDIGPGNARRAIGKIKVGPSLKRLIENTGSWYDEHMVDRIERNGGVLAEQMSPVFRKMVDRQKQLYGTLAIELDKAKAMAGGTRERKVAGQTPSREAMRAATWLHGLEPVKGAGFAAISNTVGAIEGTKTVPGFAQRVVDAAKEINLKIGQMLESVVPGYQSTGNFVSNLTPFGVKLLRGTQSKMWKHWSAELAKENGTSVRAAQRALSKLKNDLASSKTLADLKQANLDFVTAMPRPVLAFDYNNKTFRLARNFQASGKFARNITAVAYDTILRGSGYSMVGGKRTGSANIWDKWTLGLAKANKKPPEDVREFFRDFKAMLDKPGFSSSDIERINQDFTRIFPKVVTHVRHNGQWHEVVHSNLFNYLENAAQRASHIRAFREQIPNTPKGQQILETINTDLRAELGPQGVSALDSLMKTMQGVPTDNYASWGVLSPSNPFGAAFRASNATVGNLMARAALTAQMATQVMETFTGGTAAFLGYKNQMRGIANMGHTYKWMEQQGMVNRVMHDFSYDPNSPIRSSFRIGGNTISKVFAEQFLNEMQEAFAASTAKVVSDRITNKQLDAFEKRMLPQTFKAMGFNPDEVLGLMQGDAELLGQFQRKAAAFLTGGNKAISEGSQLGANRLFNSVFRFQAYPMMKMNQFRKVTKGFVDAWDTGNAIEKRNATEAMARFVGTTFVQGALTAALTTLAMSGKQGLKIKYEEAKDEPLNFLAESFLASVSGPAYVLWKSMRMKGVMGAPEALTRMIFPYTVAREISDFSTGHGRYKDRDLPGRIGEFLKARVPGSKVISNGLAMFGLSQDDKALDASVDGFRRWRREKGFKTVESNLDDDTRKAFRIQIKKAVEALKDGDQNAYLDAYLKAAAELNENAFKDVERWKELSTSTVEGSIRRATILKDQDGRKLSQDEMKELRERIGDEAVDRLEWHDLMIEQAADGVLLPTYDQAN